MCHIQPVGFNTNTSIEDLEISDIEDHFRKYVNPNNMFVLPKEIGYLGEIDVFIEEQKRKRLRDSILSPIFHSYIFAMYKNESLWI